MMAFVKYHGLGNDFVVVERPTLECPRDQVVQWCDRSRGIGGDGLIALASSERSEIDARMAIYNRDGSRPEMCGNGLRCAARHWAEHHTNASRERPIRIETDAGVHDCHIRDRAPWMVEVEMGRAEVADTPVSISWGGESRSIRPVEIGNPHGVHIGALDDEELDRLGIHLNEARPSPFESGVNLESVECLEPGRVRVTVYERGVGRTDACGTGACAVAAALHRTTQWSGDEALTVVLPGGSLEVDRREGTLWLRGEAEATFRGEMASSLVRGGDDEYAFDETVPDDH